MKVLTLKTIRAKAFYMIMFANLGFIVTVIHEISSQLFAIMRKAAVFSKFAVSLPKEILAYFSFVIFPQFIIFTLFLILQMRISQDADFLQEGMGIWILKICY